MFLMIQSLLGGLILISLKELLTTTCDGMIKALALYQENSGCDYHRVCLPFQYEHGRVDNKAMEAAGPTLEDKLAAAELVVWNRDFPLGIDAAIELKGKYGFKVIVDLDDYWELYPHHFLYNYYKQHDVPGIIIRNMQLADAVTVTTSRLADKVRPYNNNVHVIPNALPYGHHQFHEQRLSSEVFRFIYAGQKSHLHDVKLLQGPLQRLAGERHTDMGFVLAGYHHSAKDTAHIWPKMEKIFSVRGVMPNYRRVENAPLQQYMNVYQEADAVLVPLEANSFNSYKSNLKLLEAAAKKIPVICQRVPPYSDSHDTPVLWVDRQTDWYQHIRYLHKNRSAAQELGQQLHAWAVQQYNLFAWNNIRFDLYSHIVNS